MFYGSDPAPTAATPATRKKHAVWPCLYHESHLSQGLQELNRKSSAEQAHFWRMLASGLTPEDCGASMPHKVSSDFLGRYFDSTFIGSKSAYIDTARHLAGEAYLQETPRNTTEKLCLNGLIYVLGTHYGLAPLEAANEIESDGNFLEEGTELPNYPRLGHEGEYAAMEKLWNLVVSDDGKFVAKESFDYTLRRLRVGWMMSNCSSEVQSESFGEIFHYDYSESKLTGSMMSRKEGLKHWLWHATKKFSPGDQIAVGEPGSLFQSPEEFLYDDPHTRTGNVHWIHLHRPSNALLVMTGQMYGLGIHCLSVLCRLSTTQINYFHSREWMLFTFPEVHLEKRAQQSIREFLHWKFHDDHAKVAPPEIYVEAFTQNMAFVWHEASSSKAQDEEHLDRNYHTFISVTAKPAYLGMWSTRVERRNTSYREIFSAFFNFLSKKNDAKEEKKEPTERTPLRPDQTPGETPRDSEDSMSRVNTSHVPEAYRAGHTLPIALFRSRTPADPEAAMEQDIDDQQAARGDNLRDLLTAVTDENSEFKNVFKHVLSQLGKEYSALRMGDHRQLVFRILLDRAAGYLETARLYSAAIHVLQHRLKDPHARNKDLLISRITHAKLQLQTLVRMVEPFFDGCLKHLVADGFAAASKDRESFANRLRRTNLIDIEHNMKAFLETAHTQIQLCDLSIEQYDRDSADKGNSILNFLTIITFLVTPVQLVTSWYGMNFVHMPEFKWGHGYHYVVLLCGVFILFFFVVLRIKTLMT
mmetsp:Transcript_15033/g.26512  ORF Transcript_15033/g.26512 Transcript_15033/m.26512 type:complete len:755 (-) Transcript_15033:73-2337(-)